MSPAFDDKQRKPPTGGGPGAGPGGTGSGGGTGSLNDLKHPPGDWMGELLKETSLPPVDRAAEQAAQRSPPQPMPPGEAPPAPAAPVAAVAASSLSWPMVIGILAAFTVGVVFIGALGSCLLAGVFWYALGDDSAPAGPLDPAAEPLIAELRSEDPAARAAAADGLAALGTGAHGAVHQLQAQLDDKEDAPRYSAAKALARISGKPQTVKRETSRRYVGRQNERQVGDRIEWDDVYEIQWKMETVYPDGRSE